MAEPRWIEERKHWRMDITHRGKRKSFYSSEVSERKGKAECRRKAEEWKYGFRAEQQIRFDRAWERFIDYYGRKNYETSARQIDSRGKAHLLPRFAKRRLDSIEKREWQQVIFDAHDSGARSITTLKGIATSITTFCKWAATQGMLPDNQVPIYFDFPRDAGVQGKRILQPEEMATLFSPEVEGESFFIFCWRFLVLTGLRRGEFCALECDDYRDGYITVSKSISHDGIRTPGKNKNARRRILLTPLAAEQIEKHRQHAPDSRYLFPDVSGGYIHPRVLGNHWRKWRAIHGITSTIHELRHTHISYSRLTTDITLDELKRLYGHAESMDTDHVYVHAIDQTPEEIAAERKLQREQAAKINRSFERVISFPHPNGDSVRDKARKA